MKSSFFATTVFSLSALTSVQGYASFVEDLSCFWNGGGNKKRAHNNPYLFCRPIDSN
jgi:hypothetical protein